MKKNTLMGLAVVATAALITITAVGAKELRMLARQEGNGTAAMQPLTNGYNAYAPQNAAVFTNVAPLKQSAELGDGVQEIRTELDPLQYPALTVQKDVPVRWTIVATENTLHSCNNEIVIPALGLRAPLEIGENVIEFTPTASGILQYSCWMGMMNSTIAVVEDINNYDAAALDAQIAELPRSTGGCGMGGASYGNSEGSYGGGCCRRR